MLAFDWLHRLRAPAAEPAAAAIPPAPIPAPMGPAPIPVPTGPARDRLPQLIDPASERRLAAVAYAGGHGVSDGRLGLSLLYYALPYALRARTAVCLGSGGGLVPELMRRAQSDLGLVGARTYLVDAILPEAGFGGPEVEGGWFARRAEFQSPDQDVWLLQMLTEEAARLVFGRLGRRIDLLHIDADHSYAGAKLDFELFTPLMHPQGVVTLHDLRMPGIARLVDEIEATGDWSTLRFADIGQGLAVLRRRQGHLPPVLVGCYNRTEADGSIVNAQPEPQPEAPPVWEYLTKPALYARHAIAAQWLGAADLVLEIGGYLTPIGPHLRDVPRDYVMIDPLCEPLEAEALGGRPCRVRHIRADLDTLDTAMLDGRDYAVVFLGAQLDPGTKGFGAFVTTAERYLRILSGAGRAVIEFPPAWPSCRELFDVLQAVLKPRVEFEVTLDLSQNPMEVDGQPVPAERLVRRLFVLSGFAPMPPEAEARALIAQLYRGADGARLLAPSMMDPVPAATEGAAWAPTQDGPCVTPEAGGTLVETVAQAWAYSAVLPLNAAALRPGTFLVEMTAEAVQGVVYATTASPDLSAIGEQRRFVPDAEGRATLQLEETAETGRTVLLLRNGDRAEPGRVRILGVTIRQ
jgi:hypothetical protein